MAAIKGKGTKLEKLLRKALHAHGFRYRLHDENLPGKPDLVFPQFNAVVFVHGCFWHGHDCESFRWPTTRAEFWKTKITANAERDQRQLFELKHNFEKRSLVVWGCALTGKQKLQINKVVQLVDRWFRVEQSDPSYWRGSIRGYDQ